MKPAQKNSSERQLQRKRKYHLTILVLMLLLLAALFVVQCQLSHMKADMLAERKTEIDDKAKDKKFQEDSLQRYKDSLAAALLAVRQHLYNFQPVRIAQGPADQSHIHSVHRKHLTLIIVYTSSVAYT